MVYKMLFTLLVSFCMLSGLSKGLSVSAASTTRSTAASHKPAFNWDKIKYFYAFGDSYTFVQGTEGLANFR